MARPRISYTILLACLLVLLASPSPSTALSHDAGKQHVPRLHQHAQLVDSKKRMVKVRQLFGKDKSGTDVGTGDNTGDTATTTTTTSSAAAVTTTTAAGTTTTTTTTTPAQQSQSVVSTTSAVDSASSSSAVVSTTSATTTVPATSSATTSASLNIIPQSSSSPSASSLAASQTFSVATAQVTVDLPTQSSDADTSTTSANTFGRNTIIAIVVIASCVGGAAAIWTLIRKWKLGPSAKFEERMAPIEWSPDMGSTAGAGIPGAEREKAAYGATEKHSRSGSHGSFHSSDAEHNNLGRNVTGNGNMFADQHPPSYGPEAHDFTAGPAHYNAANGFDAYGNPAAAAPYVDLQRTNSNGSNRSDKDGLQRGQSISHAAAAPYAYDNGYHNNAAYGHDAYAQDAYAGYDAYGQHYPPQQGQYGAQQGQYGARY